MPRRAHCAVGTGARSFRWILGKAIPDRPRSLGARVQVAGPSCLASGALRRAFAGRAERTAGVPGGAPRLGARPGERGDPLPSSVAPAAALPAERTGASGYSGAVGWGRITGDGHDTTGRGCPGARGWASAPGRSQQLGSGVARADERSGRADRQPPAPGGTTSGLARWCTICSGVARPAASVPRKARLESSSAPSGECQLGWRDAGVRRRGRVVRRRRAAGAFGPGRPARGVSYFLIRGLTMLRGFPGPLHAFFDGSHGVIGWIVFGGPPARGLPEPPPPLELVQ